MKKGEVGGMNDDALIAFSSGLEHLWIQRSSFTLLLFHLPRDQLQSSFQLFLRR